MFYGNICHLISKLIPILRFRQPLLSIRMFEIGIQFRLPRDPKEIFFKFIELLAAADGLALYSRLSLG